MVSIHTCSQANVHATALFTCFDATKNTLEGLRTLKMYLQISEIVCHISALVERHKNDVFTHSMNSLMSSVHVHSTSRFMSDYIDHWISISDLNVELWTLRIPGNASCS